MARQETSRSLDSDGMDESRERALEWFALLQDGSATQDERAAFEAWYAAVPENEEAYARVADLWGAPEFSAALSSAAVSVVPDGKRTGDPAGTIKPLYRRRWGMYVSAMAAVLLLGVFLGLDRFGLFAPEADYRTGIGEVRKVALADGSILTLNTDSAVRVVMGSGQRRVELLEGEGFFEVVRDEERPFVVVAGEATVRVLGTSFSVFRDDSRMAVAVKSGRVSVFPAKAGKGDIVLAPGQQAEVPSSGPARVWREEGGGAFAWLNGRIAFQNAALGDVLAALDRHYDGWIYTVGDIDGFRVSGNFRLDQPASVVHALAQSAGAKLVHLPGDILILR